MERGQLRLVTDFMDIRFPEFPAPRDQGSEPASRKSRAESSDFADMLDRSLDEPAEKPRDATAEKTPRHAAERADADVDVERCSAGARPCGRHPGRSRRHADSRRQDGRAVDTAGKAARDGQRSGFGAVRRRRSNRLRRRCRSRPRPSCLHLHRCRRSPIHWRRPHSRKAQRRRRPQRPRRHPSRWRDRSPPSHRAPPTSPRASPISRASSPRPPPVQPSRSPRKAEIAPKSEPKSAATENTAPAAPTQTVTVAAVPAAPAAPDAQPKTSRNPGAETAPIASSTVTPQAAAAHTHRRQHRHDARSDARVDRRCADCRPCPAGGERCRRGPPGRRARAG